MNKIRFWLKNHKPLDWKYIIIFFLAFQWIKTEIYLSILFLVGLVTYPSKVDYLPIFDKAADKIAQAYKTIMIKIFEYGYNLGKIIYPNNRLFGLILNIILLLIVSTIIVLGLLYVINTIMYKPSKSK